MITFLHKQPIPTVQPAGTTTTRRAPVTPAVGQNDFQKLFQLGVSGGTSTSGTAGGNSTNNRVTPPVSGGTPATLIPVPPITNPMDQSQVEAHMNAWLQNVTQQANTQKLQVYQQAVTDWQTNCQRAHDLGLPAPPQPAAPTLDPVGPKPTGWWFS